jgi:carbonic anhydrase/acetyltransferase-like protein (isoleucine patch superfamily)
VGVKHDTSTSWQNQAETRGSTVGRLRHRLAKSNHPAARSLKALRKRLQRIGLPFPPFVFRPFLWSYLGVRKLWFTVMRIFVCEPLFRGYCTSVGRGFRTGVFVHWVQGSGRIIIGNDVTIDGRSSFAFGSSFSEAPTLSIGDGTTIGHGCSFAVGKRITIGRHCLIAQGVSMLDSSGHPLDPAKRLAGAPPDVDDVKPIVVGDNVWIGDQAKIMPGATIGDGAVVAAGSVVGGNVPPNVLVAGYPARKLRDLLA